MLNSYNMEKITLQPKSEGVTHGLTIDRNRNLNLYTSGVASDKNIKNVCGELVLELLGECITCKDEGFVG